MTLISVLDTGKAVRARGAVRNTVFWSIIWENGDVVVEKYA